MGFKSPLFLLGIGAPQSSLQAGFRTPLPFWQAGSVTTATQAGFLTILPFWAAGGIASPVIDVPGQPGGGTSKRKRLDHTGAYAQALREDEDIIIMVQAWLAGRSL